MSRLLLIAVFLEVGVLLVVIPWTHYWDRNYFIEMFPHIQAFVGNAFVRGAVSGLGVVNLFAGAAELMSLVLANRSEEPPTIAASSGAHEE